MWRAGISTAGVPSLELPWAFRPVDRTAFRFQVRADNVAQDADDRFIFNTTDHTLWFDVNGSGVGGVTLLATLQASAVLSSADILLM